MNLQQHLQSKSSRIKAGAVAATLLLGAILLFTGGDDSSQIPIQQAAPVEKPLPPAPPNSENSRLVLELFSPSDQSLHQQLNATSYSQQIEQTLTISYVLTKCLIISQDDYRDSFRALIMYAQSAGLATDSASAEIRVRQIAESANASYALIYSRVSCRDPHLPELATQIRQWTNKIFTQE